MLTQAALSALMLSAAPTPPPPPIALSERSNGAQQRQQLIQQVVELTNRERARFGLRPLRYDVRLERAAQWMAEDMAVNGYFSHTDSLNRSIGQRVPTFGYSNYQTLRENLAAGHRAPEEVVQAWMRSPGHRDAILCSKCEHIGVGFFYKEESKFKTYWVQEFGRELE